tara:strand:- start:7333 stop:7632 length:300 start_codon:yes stop_codon:yes gene_type:complete
MDKYSTPNPPAINAGDSLNNNTAPEVASEKWIRPPLAGKACPYTGMKHAAFYREFVGCSRIRQAKMGTSQNRGTRLLWLPDIHREIHRRAEAQQRVAVN